jgi:hypothetical protein
MSHNINIGDLAIVIPDAGGANNVRRDPRIGARIKGKIPEHAVLAILPKPVGWQGAYPYDDGVHRWLFVRGRTAEQRSDGRFKIVQGWTAASKNGVTYLGRMSESHACHDTMGTSLQTQLRTGQQAYVLPADGLNVRKQADPQGAYLGGLLSGAVVVVNGGPACDTKMVWWQVQPLRPPGPKGWASEGSGPDHYLVPLTLE